MEAQDSDLQSIASNSQTDHPNSGFDKSGTIKELKRYLPAQAPLKDFIFQNNLESFLDFEFFKGLNTASEIFGYKVFLSLAEFRDFYQKGKVNDAILERTIANRKGLAAVAHWKEKLLHYNFGELPTPKVGQLRAQWKKQYKVDIDALAHPTLFRMICSYLDQGISIWNFPLWKNGFLLSVKEMEQNSFSSFFKTPRPRKLLLENKYDLEHLLKIVVGNPAYYQQYLFDQQFAHQGWSGMVSVIEDRPETLMDTKKVTLEEFIIFELLLEIDFLDRQLGEGWQPLCSAPRLAPLELFAEIHETELQEAQAIWQEAFEWTHYDEILAALKQHKQTLKTTTSKSFQAMFCIDERETSLRDYLEKTDIDCETFGTPGFFNIEFYFQPEQGKALTKLCPAPVTPKYLIKEVGNTTKRGKDIHFEKQTFSLSAGWIITQTLGFWDAIKLAKDIFNPSMGPATASSFKHMDKASRITIENTDLTHREKGLQVGFTVEEMAHRLEGLLNSIGLVRDFAPLVYLVGHGSSSVNNPFFATMDCGACSCRPGSVNARAMAFVGNHPKVRALLEAKGINIPASTQFVGGLHDTTRDEIMFYDEHVLSPENQQRHLDNHKVFHKALDLNSKERSRRFESIDTKLPAEKIHDLIRTRSVSLFEPRPELDHATNALTIIGRRKLTQNLYLDRRCFLNSYDYSIDPEGKFLAGIMRPIAPVCGGISMSYYFSRVDNQKLGAGSKLPHNVMGLFGVANGIDGDLRPGLPSQMIEAHDPLRILIVVEHYPDIVLKVLKELPNYIWYAHSWMHIAAVHPDTKDIYVFKNESFVPYEPLQQEIKTTSDMTSIIESSQSLQNIPVHITA